MDVEDVCSLWRRRRALGLFYDPWALRSEFTFVTFLKKDVEKQICSDDTMTAET
jgi:hypothetical protein